ncbi:MAG: TfoX/Sxy family protein [Alphaproteobacteria bacterium]
MTTDGVLVARTTALALPLGEVVARRMFGGYGLYLDGTMFAIVTGGALYLKADPTTAPRFEAAGASPFGYMRRGRRVRLSFWALPKSGLDDGDVFLPWAELALAAARKAKHAAAGRRKRRPAPSAMPRRRGR